MSRFPHPTNREGNVMDEQEGTLTFPDSISPNSFEPIHFEFQNNNGEMIFRIHLDGRIERGPNFTDDEASLKFWELLSEAYGIFKDNIERKAKADGMRQAISIIRIHDGFKAPLIEAFEKVDAVAAEIEKGNP